MLLSPEPPRWTSRILLVDDDPSIRELVCDYLARFSINVLGVRNGLEMRKALLGGPFDLIVLDLILPGEDGLSLCRSLRLHSGIPILMLSAKCEPADRIIGLELGADDYMAKPFEPRELVARIQSILRRTKHSCPNRSKKPRNSVSFDGWQLDGVLHQLHSPVGFMVPLSNAEVRLLWVFTDQPRQVLSREQLLSATRGRVMEAFDRTIDLQVSRLRNKLGDDPRAPQLIKTVRGEGYLFDAR